MYKRQIHVTAPFSAVLRIGELEINHEHRRVLMAGREVRLNHGEYAILSCKMCIRDSSYPGLTLYPVLMIVVCTMAFHTLGRWIERRVSARA